jgi:hypothetical protein
MLSRRDFLRGASALALTPQVERILEHHLRHEAPLLVPPPTAKRVFYMHRDPDHPSFRIVTDVLPFPRRLVKFDVIEEAFGEGSFRKLTQRDHWRLIDEGRFSRDDTFQPSVGDGYYPVWAANYSRTARPSGCWRRWAWVRKGLSPKAVVSPSGTARMISAPCRPSTVKRRRPSACCRSPSTRNPPA